MSYSRDELLIIRLARELRDHEVIGVGNQSPIPAAAALLARDMHAKHATVYILGQRDWPFEGTFEFFNLMQRGGIDVFFLSGAQIDPFGNINLHVIGDTYAKPKVRLPGGAGSGVVYFMCKRIILFKTDHGVKGFPEKLDFVTAAAASPPNVHRRSQLVGAFTPYGVMRPDEAEHRLVLAETAPGCSEAEVQARTGFDLRLDGGQPIFAAAPPSEEELRVLRTAVSQELKTIYPKFVEESIDSFTD